MKIGRRALTSARNDLARRARLEYPELVAWAAGEGPSIEAGCEIVGLDSREGSEFVKGLVHKNRTRLGAYGVYHVATYNLFRAAMLYGIVLGIHVERARASAKRN